MSSRPPITAQALSTMELFRGLPAPVLENVAGAARVRRLPRDSRVFDQGDDDARAHAVIEGSLRIIQSGRDGEQIAVRFIGPGEMFGTVSIFTGGRYPAEAITLSETVEASWSEVELLSLMAHHPQIAINMIRILGRRLQEAQDRMRELATQRAEQRVALTVLRLMRQAGSGATEGTAISFPLRRKDVADMSGTTLHTASRILKAWEKAGLLITHNRRLTVRSPMEMARIAGDTSD